MILIRTATEQKIAKEFFLNYTTGSKVSKKLYPKSKNKNVGIVSRCASKWSKAGYFDEKPLFIEKLNKKSGKKYPQKIVGYRLNLNFYFDYVNKRLNLPVNEKVRKIYHSISVGPKDSKITKSYKNEMSKIVKDKELNNIDKEIIEYIFSIKLSRVIASRTNRLYEGITRFLERIFFYQTDADSDANLESYFRKGFFVKNKYKYIKSYRKDVIDFKKRIKRDKKAMREFKKRDRDKELDQLMIDFANTSTKHFDNLRWKIQIISGFSDRDWWNLTCSFPLRKYWFMKNTRKIKNIKDEKRKEDKEAIWQRIFYSDSIPGGW